MDSKTGQFVRVDDVEEAKRQGLVLLTEKEVRDLESKSLADRLRWLAMNKGVGNRKERRRQAAERGRAARKGRIG